MDEAQAARVRNRVLGREVAADVIKRIVDLTAGESADVLAALWEELYKEAIQHYTPPPVAQTPDPHYMPDIKLRRFEATPVPYQQYKGMSVGNVMADADGRRFLVWVAEQTFVDELRDYLANPTIARELS